MTNLARKYRKIFRVVPPIAQKIMPFLEQKTAKRFDASFAYYTNFEKSKMHSYIIHASSYIAKLSKTQIFFQDSKAGVILIFKNF